MIIGFLCRVLQVNITAHFRWTMFMSVTIKCRESWNCDFSKNVKIKWWYHGKSDKAIRWSGRTIFLTGRLNTRLTSSCSEIYSRSTIYKKVNVKVPPKLMSIGARSVGSSQHSNLEIYIAASNLSAAPLPAWSQKIVPDLSSVET